MDTISTAALVTVSPYTGVSVNLATTYLSPVPGGSEVDIVAEVVKSGKQMATISVQLMHKGRVSATGMHTKYLQVADPLWGPGKAAGKTEARSKL